METGRAPQVGFKGERFFLLAPAVDDPVHGQGPGMESQGDVGLFKAARGKLKAGIQLRAAEPAKLEDAALARACGFYPAQRGRTLAAVVENEPPVPEPEAEPQ